jgi:hypothetical protein
MVEFSNGCTNPKTLEIMGKFYDNPHCGTWMMTKREDHEEVIVGFTHYADYMTVYFNVDTEVGELFIDFPKELQEKFGQMDYYGEVTVDKLVGLLEEIPHIASILE